MQLLTLCLIAALSLFATSAADAAAAWHDQTKQTVLEGRVGNFLEPGLFWLNGKDGSKTLIYTSGEATKNLSRGQNVRVTGSAPADWARLADTELAAASIERVRN